MTFAQLTLTCRVYRLTITLFRSKNSFVKWNKNLERSRVLIKCRQPAEKPAPLRSKLSTFVGKWVK